MIICSDIHIAASRTAGATPASAIALKQFTLDSLDAFLATVDESLLIGGDLFDGFNVPNADLLATYRIFDKWLLKGHAMYCLLGNHDRSRDSSKLSSFHLLGALLEGRATFISEPAMIDGDIYCLPSAVNQDEMDLWISRVPKCKFCVVHANFDNFFAVSSDHSLNLSKEQATAIPADTIYFAHEHAPRTALNGKVFIGGVQWPTSVSDCLSLTDLHAYRLGDNVEPILTWSKSAYQELDWKSPEPSEAQFIRFTGTATSEEAAAVVDTIARYRKTSTAFVVSNAVKIGENSAMDEFTVTSLEQARSFDVMGALKKFLTDEEYTILENLK